jgi:glucose-1-phosphate cytidylyltransferase
MQVVILAGGLGTRMEDLTKNIPKPMLKIGGIPIILHLMNYFANFGHTNFVIALGNEGYELKNFFLNLNSHLYDIEIDFKSDKIKYINSDLKSWNVKLIDTGLNSETGGRIKNLSSHLDDEFLLTYGDGLSNIDLNKLLESHKKSKLELTISAVRMPNRFGVIRNVNKELSFEEKIIDPNLRINGGFMVCDKKVLKFIENQSDSFEDAVISKLAKAQKLNIFLHDGFWACMDTPKDKLFLDNLFKNGNAPWIVD